MRDRGTFNFSGNLEVKKDAPLEARSLVNSYADLVKPETWTDEQGGIWKYDCMLVSCKDRPGEVYQLQPGADYTKQSSWILIGDTSELNSKVQQFINSKGAPNGLASLNESGIIPSAQLPSYVDDVIEVDTFSNLPGTGESGKIYIVQDTNLTYRWSGTDYVEISKSLALGETSSTAYPGDKGKATTDVVNSLSDNLVNDVLVSQSDKNSVSLTIKSITKNPVKKNKELLLVDGEPILLTDNTPILLADNVNDGLYDQADDKLITINQASSFTAGVMSASDKTKLDGLKAQAEIDTSISNVQNNLNAHINNRTNPHRVTKEQIGLDQVDNTSDANKPISNATQTALNGKFSATDGNALKQTIEDMPNFVVTEGSVSHKNNNISLSLRQQDLKDPVNTDSILLTFNPATDSTAGIILPSDKSKIDKIITNGNGTKYLSDNGTYKEVSGGSSSSDINIIELRDIRDIISIVYHEKDRASIDIRSVFGGSANFRSIVNDILKTHTRYFFHVEDTPDTDCIQLSGVNAWKNIDNTQYELHFIYNYYISDGNQRTCRRVTVIDSDNTDSNLFIVENVNDMYVLSKDRDRRKSVSLVGEGFDENHWYPVSFTADPNSIVPPCNLIIWNSLNNDSAGISPKPSWATNNGGFVVYVNMTIIGSGYGQIYAPAILNGYACSWGGETAVGEMRQTTQTSTFYIYLRGGANYFYTSDYADLKMTAHSSEVLDGYNTYSIKDTQGDIKDFFTYVENDLFGEVKNLQIVHDNEFNFANDSIGDFVWINYRSRYDAVTSAKAVYVGNGQAGADGAFGAVHASGFFKESDIRLKSDIAPLKHTLDQICNIPTVEFNMHDKHQIGTIAQDLENNFAEVVNTDSDGMKSVDYCMLGVVAIEGIKLLKQEVEDLKKQIKELKNGR